MFSDAGDKAVKDLPAVIDHFFAKLLEFVQKLGKALAAIE